MSEGPQQDRFVALSDPMHNLQQAHKLLNDIRARHNIYPIALRWNPNLACAAQYHADRLAAGDESGTLPDKDERKPLECATAFGYTGERVDELKAGGTIQLDNLIVWLEQEHLETIIDPDWRECGAGLSGSPCGWFLVFFLGQRGNFNVPDPVPHEMLPVSLKEEINQYGSDRYLK